MATKELNLGILAHVDAGKTTLTERLLYEAGVIDELGSVDAGTTQTDSLTLEQQRGITIRSAVASFPLGDVHVNLIDTPGHPDFIAEVERVLSVLDGAVLVISGVEGVQPQTRLLMRALQRLRIPTLVFVNKIDRAGSRRRACLAGHLGAPDDGGRAHGNPARPRHARRLLHALGRGGLRLSGPAGRGARRTRRGDHGGVRRGRVGHPYQPLRDALAAQTKRALVHPVFFGSALTGAGVESLRSRDRRAAAGIRRRSRRPGLGHGLQDRTGSERREDRLRPHVLGDDSDARPAAFGGDLEDKVNTITVFERGLAVQRPSVSAGAVGKLWGLPEIQIGDRIGETGTEAAAVISRRRRWSRSSSRATTMTARGSAWRSRSSPSRTR